MMDKGKTNASAGNRTRGWPRRCVRREDYWQRPILPLNHQCLIEQKCIKSITVELPFLFQMPLFQMPLLKRSKPLHPKHKGFELADIRFQASKTQRRGEGIDAHSGLWAPRPSTDQRYYVVLWRLVVASLVRSPRMSNVRSIFAIEGNMTCFVSLWPIATPTSSHPPFTAISGI